VSINFPNGHVKKMKKWKNVIYVPGINKNIISIFTIIYQGWKIKFVKSGFQVKDLLNHYKVIEERIKVGDLNKLDVTVESHQALLYTSMSIKELWHLRYEHLNIKYVVLIQRKDTVKSVPAFKNEHVECDGCTLGKQHMNEFPMTIHKWKIYFLELVDIDVYGPI
jgi:hypothetical protein